MKQQFLEFERQTTEEITEMINIEKSSIYLSHETEPEYERYMRILK